MSRRDLIKLHKEAIRRSDRKGYKLSDIAIFKMSQQNRRSLYRRD